MNYTQSRVKDICRQWHKYIMPLREDSHKKMHVYWHCIIPTLFIDEMDCILSWKDVISKINKASDGTINKMNYYINEYKNYG